MGEQLLVIGRGGQLARSLAERAPAHGILPMFAGRPELDLADPTSIRAAIARSGARVIVNAAAYTAVDQAESEPLDAERVNAVAPGLLAEAARECGAKLIQVSTDYVFDGAADVPYDEAAAVSPINVYGATKLAGERAVRAAAPDAVIVRTSWVYSPFGRNFVRTMLQLGQTRSELRVVDDQIGNPTSALDLADGLLTMVKSVLGGTETGLGRTYHLAGSGSASWADFAREIFVVSSRSGGPGCAVVPIPSSDWPTPAARPRNSRLDSRAFMADFGYSCPPWQSSLAATVERLLGEQSSR